LANVLWLRCREAPRRQRSSNDSVDRRSFSVPLRLLI
jgi:hypothetical protein